MISIIELEKYVANGNIFSVIINKFCHIKKSYSTILFKIYKNLKIGLYYAILSLNLANYLKIKSSL